MCEEGRREYGMPLHEGQSTWKRKMKQFFLSTIWNNCEHEWKRHSFWIETWQCYKCGVIR